MRRATFRFYAELNDFLPPERRGTEFEYSFQFPAAAKDLVEAIGVPHTEIDLLVVNGASVGFAQVIEGGEFISVYPAFRSLDVSRVSLVRAEPLECPRFVLDIHLGQLATYLRMAGFDTLYRNDYEDERTGRDFRARAAHPADARPRPAETRHGPVRLLRSFA